MNIQDAVDLLPKTPEEIAAFLLERDCKGQRGHTTRCPIAMWLKKNDALIGDVRGAYVWNFDIQCMDFSLPTHVAAFVDMVDQGKFPELELLAEL